MPQAHRQLSDNDLDWIDLYLRSEVYFINMNIRLKELAEWRGKHVTPLPEQPTLAPQSEKPKMSITGLQSGAFKAKLAEMKQKMLDAQNQGLAVVEAAQEAAKTEIDTAVAGVASKIKSEVSDALQEFSEFTNGGPV